MSTRTTRTQLTQIGPETTPGTAVAATQRLAAVDFTPGWQGNVESFKPKGYKYPTVTALGQEWMGGSLSGKLTYTELVYLLSMIVEDVTPSQLGATSAYEWTFESDVDGPDTVKTYTFEHGSSVRAFEFAYGLLSAFNYTIDRSTADVGGTVLGQEMDEGTSLTGSLSPVNLVPVLPKQVDVYMDGTAGGIGTTKLTRVVRVNFELSSRFGPAWFLDTSEASFKEAIEIDPTAQFSVMLEADSTGMGFIDDVRNGNRQYFQVLAEGADVDGGNLYTFQHNMAAEVADIADFSDEDGVYAYEVTFDLVDDTTLGYAWQFYMINELTTL